MLWTPGCPGEVWGSLGTNTCGVKDRTPPAPAATVAGARGVLGTTAGCAADCINVAGGSALMMCDPALTETELVDWLLFTSGLCMATPVWHVVLAPTAGLTLLLPFKVAPDRAVCTGGLTSVTVRPVAWFTGWAEATIFCAFIRCVCVTLFDAGGFIELASPFDITGPRLTAGADSAALLLLPTPLVTVVPSTGAALPELWEFIVWLPLKVCTRYEPLSPGWSGRGVTPLLSALPGSCPVVESVLTVDVSIVEPWGRRYDETPRTSTCLEGAQTMLNVMGNTLTHLLFSVTSGACFSCTLGETARKTTSVTLVTVTCFSIRLDQVPAGH